MTGSRLAEAIALAGLLLMPPLAYFGVSFGGSQVIPGAVLLAVAAAVTPRPAR